MTSRKDYIVCAFMKLLIISSDEFVKKEQLYRNLEERMEASWPGQLEANFKDLKTSFPLQWCSGYDLNVGQLLGACWRWTFSSPAPSPDSKSRLRLRGSWAWEICFHQPSRWCFTLTFCHLQGSLRCQAGTQACLHEWGQFSLCFSPLENSNAKPHSSATLPLSTIKTEFDFSPEGQVGI